MTQRGHRKTPTAERLEAEAQALDMRRAGVTYDVIGQRLGINPGVAHRYVSEALRRTLQEPADELRTLEVARLDRLEFAVWARAMSGDQAAVQSVLRISERRAKLLGLDAPVRAHVEVTDTVTAEIERLAASLALADQTDTTAVSK